MVTAGLLFVFCVIKSICPIQLVTDHYGYDVIWFVCVYLVGAWLYRYKEEAYAFMKKKALLLYLCSCVLIGVMSVVLYGILGKTSGATYYFSVPFHYNFLFCLTGAVGLFFVFGNLSVKEGKGADFIRKTGKYCFGVYLFHEHIDLRNKWYGVLAGVLNKAGENTFLYFVTELVFCVAVIFTAGICIDFIRSLLFDAVTQKVKSAALRKKK